MAGEERDFVGEARAAEGARVGYLPQEPMLDEGKDVFGNVVEGLAETKALLDRFEAVSARFAEDLSLEEMEALIAEQGELQEKIDQAQAWDLDRTIEIAMDALRCPPEDAAALPRKDLTQATLAKLRFDSDRRGLLSSRARRAASSIVGGSGALRTFCAY
jgi:ATPase subunit of ABC transporter with duplicated ATPase domains